MTIPPLPKLDPESEKKLGEFIIHLAQFMAGQTDTCWHCKGKVEEVEQIGNCVYARPCGCRAYQGKVTKAWKQKMLIGKTFTQVTVGRSSLVHFAVNENAGPSPKTLCGKEWTGTPGTARQFCKNCHTYILPTHKE